MSAIRLTASQRQQLEACLPAAPGAGFYRRAVALLALDEGQSVGAVADLLGVSRQSVYNWAEAYDHAPGPEALRDHYGGGRPSLWTRSLQRLLQGQASVHNGSNKPE